MDGSAWPGLDYANLMLSLLLLPHMPHSAPSPACRSAGAAGYAGGSETATGPHWPLWD